MNMQIRVLPFNEKSIMNQYLTNIIGTKIYKTV